MEHFTFRIVVATIVLAATPFAPALPARAQDQAKPNILFIMGDDIG